VPLFQEMSMLPRLRPRTFYDLVIEVAIVRPGPIQGDMVHPYLRRRQGIDKVTYPSEAVKGVLKRTLGVPLFQEQAMQLSMVAAGFTAGEADQLRRAMAAWKRRGGIGHFRDKLLNGMAERGYTKEFSESLFRQLEGFGDYGFPESHAASFALLVYFSAWLKCHYPAAFLIGMLNSLPMGFYSASQLVQDAQRHGVKIRPVDVTVSQWEATLEDVNAVRPHVRFGLNRISGLSQAAAERIAAARTQQPFASVADLAHRAALQKRDLELLADANALASLSGHRRGAAWETSVVRVQGDLLEGVPIREELPPLVAPTEPENMIADYASLGLTLGRHPMTLLRNQLTKRQYVNTAELRQMPTRKLARCAGFVTCRQRPSTSNGVIFVTLEDETGMANVIVHPKLALHQRKELLNSRLLGVMGVLQCEGEVVHLIAKRLVDHSDMLGSLHTSSRDFC
jgi:error-prone DNA polymerase